MVMVAANPAGQLTHLMQRSERVVHCAHHKTKPPEKILRRKRRHMSPERLAKTGHGGLKFTGKQLILEGQGFGQAAAKDADKMPAAIGAGAKVKNRPGQELEQLSQGNNASGTGGFRFIQCRQTRLVQWPQAAGKNERVKGLFVSQVIVRGGEINSCLSRDLPHRSGFIAMQCEALFGGIQNPFFDFTAGIRHKT